jgi:hypothetical protein
MIERWAQKALRQAAHLPEGYSRAIAIRVALRNIIRETRVQDARTGKREKSAPYTAGRKR